MAAAGAHYPECMSLRTQAALLPHRATVITVSDRSAAGTRPDTAGPVAIEALRSAGFTPVDAVIVPDGAESVEAALRAALAAGARLIVTTGGTGVSKRDETPEGTIRVLDCTLPGIAEQLRAQGFAQTPMAALSRGVAGITNNALVVNLPGSPRAVSDGIALIVAVAPHVLAQLDGEDHS